MQRVWIKRQIYVNKYMIRDKYQAAKKTRICRRPFLSVAFFRKQLLVTQFGGGEEFDYYFSSNETKSVNATFRKMKWRTNR